MSTKTQENLTENKIKRFKGRTCKKGNLNFKKNEIIFSSLSYLKKEEILEEISKFEVYYDKLEKTIEIDLINESNQNMNRAKIIKKINLKSNKICEKTHKESFVEKFMKIVLSDNIKAMDKAYEKMRY